MFGCRKVSDSMTSSGSLSYLEGPQSDHRGLFVDLDPQILMRDSMAPLPIAAHNMRLLKTGNPESVELYNASMKKYYKAHQMTERLEELHKNRHTMSTHTIQNLLEKWDSDQGCAMQHAETQLSRPQKPFQWSPNLRNAGLLYRYWKMRLREITDDMDFSMTYQRIQQQIAQHDASFWLPFLGIHLTSTEIKAHINQAERHLKKCQKDSQGLRHRCYHDILAMYANDDSLRFPPW